MPRFNQSNKRGIAILLAAMLLLSNLFVTSKNYVSAESGTGSNHTIAAWMSQGGIVNENRIAGATSGLYRNLAQMTVIGNVKYDSASGNTGYVDWREGINTKYWLVTLSTKNFDNITLSSEQRSGNSGPKDFAVEVSTDQIHWTKVKDVVLPPSSSCNSDDCRLVDQKLPEWMSDQEQVYIRWVIQSAAAANPQRELGEWGVSTIDNVIIKGNALGEVIEPLIAVSTTPAHQDKQVNKDTEVAVVFNKEITLLDNGIQVVNGSDEAVSGTYATIDEANKSRLIIHTPQFDYGETYTITIMKENVQGIEGAALISDFTWSFTLAESPNKPRLVNMAFNGDPRTSIAFAWYTDQMTPTVAEVIEADKVTGDVFPDTGAKVFRGTEEIVNTYLVAGDRQTDKRTAFVSHKVIADGLEPGVTYRYRLGNGESGSWSKVGSFTTDTAEHQDYRFIVGADSQASSLSNFEAWGDTFRKAVQYMGSPKFLISAGDLVDNGDLETQWQWMLQVAEDSLLHVPFVPVLGGHEVNDYDGDVTTDNSNFYHHFNVPRQVVAGTHEGSVYSFEYGDALYIVFNSQYEGGLASNGKDIDWEDPEFRAQVNWMKHTVAKSDKKWKFVSFHKSPYASGDNSALYEDERVQFYRQHLIPVFDELGIDMVFEAHDHMYMRSFQMYGNKVIPEDELTFDGNGHAVNPKGTIYLMPNALGNKFYTKQEYLHEFDENWNPVIKKDENGNPILYDHFFANINEQPFKKMFIDVSVTSDVLSFDSFTAAVADEEKEGTVGKGLFKYDSYGIKRTDLKPNAPANAAVKVDGTAATIIWSAPESSNEPIRGYRIYEKNDKLAVHWSEYIAAEQDMADYSLVVPQLNPSKKYDFVIKAVGARMNSIGVEVTTIDGPVELEPPSAPTDLSGTAVSQFEVNLKWAAPSGNVEVSGYHLYRDGVKIANLPASAAAYADSGLSPDTNYLYHVTAYSPENVESMASNSIDVRTNTEPSSTGLNRPFPQHTDYAGNSIMPNHISQAEMDATVLRLFQEWKNKYLTENPYDASQKYVWYSDGSWFEEETDEETGMTYMPITVSEAHGYGMLILALMAGLEEDTRDDFDDMFRYFKAHPSEINPNLMAWQQGDTGTAIIDINGVDSATDGDMDIAYALLLAHSQWGSSGDVHYLNEAKKLINAIMDAEVNKTDWTLRIADWATSGKWASATRPSDWMTQHLKDYRLVSGDKRWDQVIDQTYAILNSLFKTHSTETGLIPDFVIKDGQSFIPAPPWFLESENDGDYYYNSARTPWRLGTDYLISGEKRALEQLTTMNNWIRAKTDHTPSNIRSGYTLDGDTELAEWEDLTFSAPFMVSAMIDQSNQQWLNKLWDYNAAPKTEDEVYFSNNIRLLSMIVASGNWWTPAIVDYEAPAKPVIDYANAVSSSTIQLKWLASTDNVGVKGYKVFRDGVEITTVASHEFKDTGLLPAKQYAYTVIAYDAAGNQSEASNVRLVTTLNNVPGTWQPEKPVKEEPGDGDGDEDHEEIDDQEVPKIDVSDIKQHWAEAIIKKALLSGLFKGYPNGTFQPDRAITREQFAVVAARALDLPASKRSLTFSDEASISDWARQAVAQSLEAGLVQGYGNGTFQPQANISRAEMGVILGRIIRLKGLSEQAGTSNQASYADESSIPFWAKQEVAEVSRMGIMQGKGQNRFAPADNATRAEAVKVWLKLMEFIE